MPSIRCYLPCSIRLSVCREMHEMVHPTMRTPRFPYVSKCVHSRVCSITCTGSMGSVLVCVGKLFMPSIRCYLSCSLQLGVCRDMHEMVHPTMRTANFHAFLKIGQTKALFDCVIGCSTVDYMCLRIEIVKIGLRSNEIWACEVPTWGPSGPPPTIANFLRWLREKLAVAILRPPNKKDRVRRAYAARTFQPSYRQVL